MRKLSVKSKERIAAIFSAVDKNDSGSVRHGVCPSTRMPLRYHWMLPSHPSV